MVLLQIFQDDTYNMSKFKRIIDFKKYSNNGDKYW